MNQYVTGAVIKKLREKNNMTQCQLADKLLVSDKPFLSGKQGKGIRILHFWSRLQRHFPCQLRN